MTIEVLNKENIEYLMPLVHALWPHADLNEELDNYRNAMLADNEICYLSKEAEHYIGFIHAAIRNDYVEGSSSSPVGYIEGVYVRPAFQRLGIGKQLIQSIEVWARENGCSELGSDTELSNTSSILFHQQAGFEEANRIVCFIKKL